VAKEVELADKFENMGAQMVKEVASKTSDVAATGHHRHRPGQKIYQEGRSWSRRATTDGPQARDRQGRRGRRRRAQEDVQGDEGPKEIAQVGTISANNDETIGNIISEAMAKVGKEGVITVEEAKGMETTLEIVEGCSSTAATSPRTSSPTRADEVILEDPYSSSRKKISNMRTCSRCWSRSPQRKPLLIVAEEVEGERWPPSW